MDRALRLFLSTRLTYAVVRAYYGATGASIIAADYLNPDAKRGELRHLLFPGAQAFQFTPEEEHAYEGVDWGLTRSGAIADLGRSAWYHSFTNVHSADARHFRVLFYDEVLDIVCREIQTAPGGYSVGQSG